MTTWTDHAADRPSRSPPRAASTAPRTTGCDEAWLAAAWSHPTTRVLRGLRRPGPDRRHAGRPHRLVMTPSFEAPLTEAHRYFLGTDEEGVRYFALQKDALPGRMDQSARPAGLREAGAAAVRRATPG